MLKNKIIALLSVATMMFSFVTIANAEKTPIVTDPTFAVKLNKQNADGTCTYYFGVSFDDADPFTFKKTLLNENYEEDGEDPEYEYSGIGAQLLDIVLEANDASAAITKVTGTKGISFTQANLDINYTATTVADYAKLSSRGEGIYTKFTVTTSKYVDPADFKCAKLTLAIKDASNASNSWVYSSDAAMVEAGAADFLAYTAKSTTEPTPSYPSNEQYVTEAIDVADVENPYVRVSLGEKINDYYLPAGVKGAATVHGLLKYTADGKNINHGDVFKLELRSKTTAEGTFVKALADHTVNAAD